MSFITSTTVLPRRMQRTRIACLNFMHANAYLQKCNQHFQRYVTNHQSRRLQWWSNKIWYADDILSYNIRLNKKTDWTLDGGDMKVTNGALELQLTQSNGGTKISSTRYVHYGQFSAESSYISARHHRQFTDLISITVKTGKWPGVVAAFISMSDIKDEIEYVVYALLSCNLTEQRL